MTYRETAAQGQSAGGGEGAHHEIEPPEVRQWTIKNLDANVVAKARAAAKRKGMKISSWVALTLEQAADSELHRGGPSANKSPLSVDIEEIVARIEDVRREDRLLFEKIEKDISQLVRGQHGMLTEMLSRGASERFIERRPSDGPPKGGANAQDGRDTNKA
jgi:hypothetical protein